MIRQRTLLPGLGLAVLAACTPIGLWVWEDPAFEVARVRMQEAQAADSTMTVALYVWNPNDYDLSTARFELHLQLDGETVGRYARDSIIPLTRAQADTLTLAFLPVGAPSRRLEAFRGGTHRFVVEGHAVLTTPFGDRPVRVVHAGDIAFGASVEPVGDGGSARRPPPELPMPDRWPTAWRDAERPSP